MMARSYAATELRNIPGHLINSSNNNNNNNHAGGSNIVNNNNSASQLVIGNQNFGH